jgi:BON domain
MDKVARKRAEQTLDSAVGALDQARGVLVRRLDDIDFKAMQKRGLRWAGAVRSDLDRRVRPRRQTSPWTIAGLAGLVALGMAAVGAGYVVLDRDRRRAVQSRFGDARHRARQRYAELVGRRTQLEADLDARVRQAIAEGGALPSGLEVSVEGRTVYLRGAVPDPAFVDAAAERVHGIPGVVAVVNLTTGAAEDKRSRTPQRA